MTEAEDWAKWGCKANEDWHNHLKEEIEKGFVPDEVDGCYVGTLKPLRRYEY